MSVPPNNATIQIKDKDRRRSERRPLVVEAWVSSPTAVDPLDREEVTSVNVSRHGVAFDRRTPLPVGTFHIIDLSMGEQRMRCEARIMTCRKLDSGLFEIGAEFC
ncbi:MAG TPA: PilZ domain-containing protein [Tepidisphaeraceae bacterium]|nr:PilZ domain-containing protein [Tepidisphaeraceae bacterium]